MKAPVRLGLYGVGLMAVFALAFATAGAVVPTETVQAWGEEISENHHVAGDGDHEADGFPLGMGLAQDGYQLTGVRAPSGPGAQEELSFTVTGPDGNPVADFELDHQQEMHLIAVRADGQFFAHVHPERDEDGTWSIPWVWEAAGAYRIFADFVPVGAREGMTLSTTVQVAGDYDPAPAEGPITETTVDGFDVAVTGDLVAGSASRLTMTVTRDGEPVTELEPYLGAFGHLVTLREGDLAYLHVHPRGHTPEVGETSGPQIVFEVTAPTPGRYLLYLDFQTGGQVHTASMALDTTEGGAGPRQDEHEQGADHDH